MPDFHVCILYFSNSFRMDFTKKIDYFVSNLLLEFFNKLPKCQSLKCHISFNFYPIFNSFAPFWLGKNALSNEYPFDPLGTLFEKLIFEPKKSVKAHNSNKMTQGFKNTFKSLGNLSSYLVNLHLGNHFSSRQRLPPP